MATLTTTPIKTFVSGETVTPAKLNELSQSTVALTAGSIVAADIASDAVTTAKILDANVTNAKIASGVDAAKLTTGTLPIARIADAAVTPAKLSQPYTLATAQASTSGTNIDFTGIPSWAKRITVMFSGISTNGSTRIAVQLGTSSGFTTSGYTSFCGLFNSVGAQDVNSVTNGFGWWHGSTTDTEYGHMIITNISANNWISSHSGGFTNGSVIFAMSGGGSVSLSGTLDRVRITTVNGADAFDAGSINIAYEG